MKSAKSGPLALKNQASGDDPLLIRSPWVWWRTLMPVAQKWAYLDHAAVSPLSGPAASAIHEFAEQAAQDGDTCWPDWAATVERLRKQFASLLHADSTEICLVPNTSTGINLVAEGWPWKPGDSVVVPEGEFPSNLFPWLNQRERGVEVRQVPRDGGAVRVDDLISAVDASTRMIAVSWVGYASGYRVDLDRLVNEAHRRGVLVFLDAIQGLGMYPLDLRQTPVDFLAADGHKWLLGPEGLGVAMIAQRHLDRLRCGNVGWNSVKNSFNYAAPEFALRSTAARFESGSANMIGAVALSASLQLFSMVREAHGPLAIQQRVVELVDQLDQSLQDVGATTRAVRDHARRSGILTFEVPGVEASVVRSRALQEKIVVSCRDGGVRASVHAYNDEQDLARLVEVVRRCRCG